MDISSKDKQSLYSDNPNNKYRSDIQINQGTAFRQNLLVAPSLFVFSLLITIPENLFAKYKFNYPIAYFFSC